MSSQCLPPTTCTQENKGRPVNSHQLPRTGKLLLIIHITKYGSILYIGMDEVLAHYACTFENSNLHTHQRWLNTICDRVHQNWAYVQKNFFRVFDAYR